MAKDIKLVISGDARDAEAALKELQRSGSDVAHALERDFDALGTKSAMVFDRKREVAQKSYQRIKSSGLSSAADIAAAEKGLAKTLTDIDRQQYGERTTMAQKFRDNIGKIAAAAGVAYGAFQIGSEAVDQAKDFEAALTDLGKVGVKNIGDIRDQIMAMPEELGSAQQLVKGYYQVISAGVTEPRQALDLLTTAAKTAKAAHLEQEDVIKALTKVMAGYGDKIKDANQASDLLFNMERFGQTSVAELTPVIGGLASLSAQLGVLPQEMGAAVSSITQTAGSTAQAATQYEAILSGFIKPTKNMADIFIKLGVESGRELISKKGLSGALLTVKEAAEQAFGEGGLGKIFESKEALTALGPLFKDGFKGVNETAAEIAKNAGAADRAFQDWKGTFEATEQTFHNTVGKVLIELGTELAPAAKEALEGVAGWMSDNKDGIIDFVQGIGSVVEGVVKGAEAAVGAVKSLANAAAEISLQVEKGSGPLEPYTPQSFLSTIFSGSSQSEGSLSPEGAQPYNLGHPLAVGTRYVPKTGFYQLHRGEEVRTRGDASRTSAPMPVNFNGDIVLNMPNIAKASPQESRDMAKELIGEIQRLGVRFA